MKDKKIVSARRAGEMLGVPAQKVRERMKSGAWDIGTVVKTDRGYQYDVSIYKLRKLIGMEGDE